MPNFAVVGLGVPQTNALERGTPVKSEYLTNKMLSYRRETALQGALQFSPKVKDWNCMGDNILRTL